MKDTFDYLSEEERSIQAFESLLDQLNFVSQNSPYYHRLWKAKNIEVAEIHSLEDFQNIPVTTKADLAQFQSEFVAVDQNDIAEYVTTSGSTGTPVTIALTQGDIDRLAYNEARSLEIAGILPEDVVQITTTLDKQFMAGMAYYSGLLSLGATVVRSGPGGPNFQCQIAARHRANAMIGVPSYLSTFISQIESAGIEKVVCIGEPIREADFTPNALGEKLIHSKIQWRSTYASTEIATAFTECEAQAGGHLLPELVYIEILDENNRPVPHGELGEVTLTPLGITGTPLIRYKTGDLARIHYSQCKCKRTTPRLGPIEGRISQQIKFKGTTLYPPQIENCLHQLHISTYVIKIFSQEPGSDMVEIYLSKSKQSSDSKEIEQVLKDGLRVLPSLVFCEDEELHHMLFPNENRKPLKVQDLRHG